MNSKKFPIRYNSKEFSVCTLNNNPNLERKVFLNNIAHMGDCIHRIHGNTITLKMF